MVVARNAALFGPFAVKHQIFRHAIQIGQRLDNRAGIHDLHFQPKFLQHILNSLVVSKPHTNKAGKYRTVRCQNRFKAAWRSQTRISRPNLIM
jgi:hypothetical protein